MTFLRLALLPVVITILVGCEAAAPLGSIVTLPEDSAQKCATLCKDAKLEMSSLVVVRNSVGCVCQVPGKAVQSGARDAASATAAAETVIDDEERQRQSMMHH
jgi:hypothetical protein